MKIPLVPKLLYYISYILFNSSVPPSCSIGKGTKFAYGGIGVVIHANAKIGSNCIIGQGITIGGKTGHNGVPEIGNNVYIAAGTRIIGNVKINNNVVIGCNSVVLQDIPEKSVAAGVPAKVIHTNVDVNKYANFPHHVID